MKRCLVLYRASLLFLLNVTTQVLEKQKPPKRLRAPTANKPQKTTRILFWAQPWLFLLIDDANISLFILLSIGKVNFFSKKYGGRIAVEF
jgi:hypothetical protein